MSRTYRRSGITNCYPNLEAWEAKEIEYETFQVSRWEAAQIDYGYSEWRAEEIDHYQNEIAKGVERTNKWFVHFRDGREWQWLNNSLGKSFRERCNRDIRTKTRHLERKIKMDSEAYDNLSFPDKHDTKYLYWVYD